MEDLLHINQCTGCADSGMPGEALYKDRRTECIDNDMLERLYDILERSLGDQLILAVVSAPRRKSGASKIKIRPVLHRERLLFQVASQVGKQEFHENLEKNQAIERLAGWLLGDFGQLQMDLTDRSVTVLTSKKGKVTVKEKRKREKSTCADLSHNRKKRYILEEDIPVPFLVDLGVMTREGKIVRAKYDKFRQINRFLEFIEDIREELPEGREVTILDFGCGKSYLTFAMYYYLRILKGMDIRVIGLDLKKEVIEHCEQLALEYGYDKLKFLTGDIASYTGCDAIDMVVTLHACDTATDFALEKAVKWGAKVILSVPCCQHELNGQVSAEILEPILRYGLIKERLAALMTDALRAGMLEEQGYQVQILEFIDMEHTPKNILIRAVKGSRPKESPKLAQCMEFLGVNPTLRGLLEK